MPKSIPKYPPGLHAAGRRVWKQIHTEYLFDGQPHAVMLVEELARTADVVARIQTVVDSAESLRAAGSRGQDVSLPELDQLKHYRAQFAALIRQLDLPEPLPEPTDADDGVRMTRHQAAVKAAATRWGKI